MNSLFFYHKILNFIYCIDMKQLSNIKYILNNYVASIKKRIKRYE